jgi:hypothetical protein
MRLWQAALVLASVALAFTFKGQAAKMSSQATPKQPVKPAAKPAAKPSTTKPAAKPTARDIATEQTYYLGAASLEDLYNYAMKSTDRKFVATAADKLASRGDTRAADLTLRVANWS